MFNVRHNYKKVSLDLKLWRRINRYTVGYGNLFRGTGYPCLYYENVQMTSLVLGYIKTFQLTPRFFGAIMPVY